MQFTRTMHIAAPRARVWELLADTERLNREVGLPPVDYTFLPRAVGGTEMTGTTKIGPMQVRYRERPFEWVRPDFYSVHRLFEQGPLREMQMHVTLTEEQEGTRVHCVTTLIPRNLAYSSIVRVAGTKMMNDMVDVWKNFSAYLLGQTHTPRSRRSQKAPIVRDRLERALVALRDVGADETIAQHLANHLEHASAQDVLLIRPYALADRWELPRKAVLRTCLLAARKEVGLLELRWRLLCPTCRNSAPENVARRLRDVTAQVLCPSCNLHSGPDFDKSVEVSFAVAPTIRPVSEALYCRGGPGFSPHVWAQFALEPGKTRTVPVHATPGHYALVSPQSNTHLSLRLTEPSEAGAGSAEPPCVMIEAQADSITLDMPQTRLDSQAEWKLVNRTEELIVLRLESQEVGIPVVTAAQVTSMPAFRDSFSSEVLAPGMEVAVRQICVLFSDLKGSTAMYRERGDAPSYRTVRDHFQIMSGIITEHEGVLIKTIGDAVMATFNDPAQGLTAALTIQKAAQTWPDKLIVKLGLHSGPAIAVNANDLLDYFGQTVNLASRLQSQSWGGDIVIAEELLDDPVIARLVEDHTCHLQPFTHLLNGFETPISMLRITLPEEVTVLGT
jgi:class 3 adenylate cyclase/carbon monoxide dehydrogenase subunit G